MALPPLTELTLHPLQSLSYCDYESRSHRSKMGSSSVKVALAADTQIVGVAMAAYSNSSAAVGALRAGSFDYSGVSTAMGADDDAFLAGTARVLTHCSGSGSGYGTRSDTTCHRWDHPSSAR